MVHPIGIRHDSSVKGWVIGRSGFREFMKLMMLGRMDTFVFLQILGSLERLAADLTRMRLEGSVY